MNRAAYSRTEAHRPRIVLSSRADNSARRVSPTPNKLASRPKGYFGRVTEIATYICLIVRCVMTIRPANRDRLSDDQRITLHTHARGA